MECSKERQGQFGLGGADIQVANIWKDILNALLKVLWDGDPGMCSLVAGLLADLIRLGKFLSPIECNKMVDPGQKIFVL